MEVLEIDPISYDSIFINPVHVFNTARFNELNKANSEKMYCLAFKDSKVRVGIVFGVRNNELLSPFSAPFGGFQYINEEVKITQIDNALNVLELWAKQKGFECIKITLPPVFYHQNFINKQTSSLFRFDYQQTNLELNYEFPVSKLNENYLKNVIWYNARKNLNNSMKNNLVFTKLDSKKGKEAYDVIAQNRKEKGYPLRMSWSQIMMTMEIVSIDFFIVELTGVYIASAIVFQVSDKIVQVVYWGDLKQYSDFKTMNFLSYNIFQFYKQKGISIIDIGPSTENSIPNIGLCEFKESIGCDISNKSIFTKKLN